VLGNIGEIMIFYGLGIESLEELLLIGISDEIMYIVVEL
jgi:hypothetical protein